MTKTPEPVIDVEKMIIGGAAPKPSPFATQRIRREARGHKGRNPSAVFETRTVPRDPCKGREIANTCGEDESVHTQRQISHMHGTVSLIVNVVQSLEPFSLF